jgi:hypothetical protein
MRQTVRPQAADGDTVCRRRDLRGSIDGWDSRFSLRSGRPVAVMPTCVASDALTRDRVRRWTVSGRRLPTALARLRSEADRYRLENAVQLRHLTASIVVLAATAGAVALKAASITVRRGGPVTDNARAAGRSIA